MQRCGPNDTLPLCQRRVTHFIFFLEYILLQDRVCEMIFGFGLGLLFLFVW